MPLAVLSAGFQTTVQDCGRFGFRKFGVASGGALDTTALRLLNGLVGNDECAAGIEMTNGRLRLEFADDRLIAWSGGDCDMRIDMLSVPQLHCAPVFAAMVCEILAKRGRAWLAISGGVEVPHVLGSRSTDLRARFGGFEGRALRDRDELLLGVPGAAVAVIAKQMRGPIADWSAPQLSSPGALRIIPGKHWSAELGARFLAEAFRVAMNSDRMGLRLEGARLDLNDAEELVSEPVAPGTIQLPRSGNPIVLLADCQTVGGYHKLAHVITVDLARAAQLQPMDQVRFELTTIEHAQELLRERERDIALFRAGLQARFG